MVAAQPRAVHLDAGMVQGPSQERYELIPIDTLFFIENRGLERILVDLNGHRFRLASDPDEVARSSNAFPIPEFGRVTFNISAYLVDTDNYVEVEPFGPPGADALIIIGDLLVPGEEVKFAVTDLVELPSETDLLAGYPNPFRESVTLSFEIPESWAHGVPVEIAIYDALGRRRHVLVADHRYPGRFTVSWTPSDGEASGIFFCQMTAGSFRQAIRLVYVR